MIWTSEAVRIYYQCCGCFRMVIYSWNRGIVEYSHTLSFIHGCCVGLIHEIVEYSTKLCVIFIISWNLCAIRGISVHLHFHFFRIFSCQIFSHMCMYTHLSPIRERCVHTYVYVLYLYIFIIFDINKYLSR